MKKIFRRILIAIYSRKRLGRSYQMRHLGS